MNRKVMCENKLTEAPSQNMLCPKLPVPTLWGEALQRSKFVPVNISWLS